MPARNPEIEQQLADAIRNGASRRPEQAFGDYFHGRHASCALGAAYEGMYRLPGDMEGRRPTKDLEEYFDCLDGTVRACPGSHPNAQNTGVGGPGTHPSEQTTLVGGPGTHPNEQTTLVGGPGVGCRKVLTLSALIVHLNDDHRWTREAIAGWVAGEAAPAAETETK